MCVHSSLFISLLVNYNFENCYCYNYVASTQVLTRSWSCFTLHLPHRVAVTSVRFDFKVKLYSIGRSPPNSDDYRHSPAFTLRSSCAIPATISDYQRFIKRYKIWCDVPIRYVYKPHVEND